MSSAPICLSVIIPTFNERENIGELVRRLTGLFPPQDLEIIVVDDDSPDGTWREVQELMAEQPSLRLIRRVGRHGLSSAVVEGFLAARGRRLAVIDADLQHDESILPKMLAAAEDYKIVVGSRKVDDGGFAEGWSPIRHAISYAGTRLAQILLGVPINDPMSGFFLIRREVFESLVAKINPQGFKILLEIIHRSGIREIKEVGYTFRPRVHGESKLTGSVGLAFLWSLYDLVLGHVIPARFIKFSLVGLSGVAINLLALSAGINLFAISEQTALMVAIGLAMVSNYLLNNMFTFAEQAHRGWHSILRGLGQFCLFCSVGAVINFATAFLLITRTPLNIYAADLVGVVVATVWNYTFSARMTWKAP